MDISTRQSGTATIVDVVGDITLYNSPQVRKVLLELLKDKKAPRVIVNLENVRYIDIAGFEEHVCVVWVEPDGAGSAGANPADQSI
jgi:anti-anti-sigma factor